MTFMVSTSFRKFAPMDTFFLLSIFIDNHCGLSNAIDRHHLGFISMQWSNIRFVHNGNQVHMTASLMTVVIYQSVWLMPRLGWKQMSLQALIYWRSNVWQTVLTRFTSLDADTELTRQSLKHSARTIVPPIRDDSCSPHVHTKHWRDMIQSDSSVITEHAWHINTDWDCTASQLVLYHSATDYIIQIGYKMLMLQDKY